MGMISDLNELMVNGNVGLVAVLFMLNIIMIQILYRYKPNQPDLWSYPFYISLALYILIMIIILPEWAGQEGDAIYHTIAFFHYVIAFILLYIYLFLLKLEYKNRQKHINHQQ
ncbi:hypothetical protein SAMN05444392_11198 [Seinonella peptonophila]|uniref:Uncharacterized protein n=1 Tax=Seinonella peptonophila TaxID=112248 RepID=A0A1M5A1P6_9BACL|nr:hypothetical protein [Seinonella peptonophila]SHF24141.1 hypothetical protein SAMN05444392_11198 [Seinonella peptonophila]